jgi:cytidylate kinase
MTSTTAKVDHRLKLLRRHWGPLSPPVELDVQPGARPRRRTAPTVAISREVGALGSELARKIGKRLDWPVYDREIIDLIAEESGLRTELLNSVDEHDRSWLVEAMSSFAHQGAVTSAGYVHHLVRVLTALAANGNCVIVGRGAPALLPRATTLRLRVVAELGDRVRQIARMHGLSEEDASAEVARLDRERTRFVQHHFHRDVADPRHFDLVINTSRFSLDACADLAVEALKAFTPPVAPVH